MATGVFKTGLLQDAGTYKLVHSIIYSFHMPLFFFLSGLYFSNSLVKRGWKGLISKKIDTVLYPYLLWSIIQGTTEASLSSYTNSTISYTDVFTLLWAPRAHFWFLYTLFMIFVISSFFFSVFPKKFALYICLFSTIVYIFSNEIRSVFVLKLIGNNFVFFCFGILLNKWSGSEVLGSRALLLAALVSFFSAQYVFHNLLGMMYYDRGILSLATALISILFVVVLSKTLARRNMKWLILIGSSSLAIYLLHVLTGSGTRIILVNIIGIHSIPFHLIAGVISGIYVPLLAVYFVNKYRIPYVFSMPLSNFASVLPFRFRHGLKLARMVGFAWRKMKAI